MIRLNKCLNSQKKIYGMKTGACYIGAVFGIIGCCFGFWGCLIAALAGGVVGSYMHDFVHYGVLQRYLYWYFSCSYFFVKSPKSEERVFF